MSKDKLGQEPAMPTKEFKFVKDGTMQGGRSMAVNHKGISKRLWIATIFASSMASALYHIKTITEDHKNGIVKYGYWFADAMLEQEKDEDDN